MKKSHFILLFLSIVISLNIQAQKQCIAAPDALGKYLGGLFLHQENISAEPFYSTGLAKKWQFLSNTASTNHFSSQYKYYKTYFTNSNLEPESYDIYIVFKGDTDEVAIQIEASIINNLWSITALHGEFYNLINTSENKEQFITNEWVTNGSTYYATVQENTTFSLPKTENVKCYSDPIALFEQYTEELLTHLKIDAFSTITSFEDYQTYYIPSFLDLLNKVETEDSNDLKEIAYLTKTLTEEPQSFYEGYFTGSTIGVADYLQLNHYTKENIENIEYIIQDYNNEVLGKGKLVCIANIIFNKNGKHEGIRCQALWYNDTWKIIYQQKGSYTISNAE